jgi:hypothetical protein
MAIKKKIAKKKPRKIKAKKKAKTARTSEPLALSIGSKRRILQRGRTFKKQRKGLTAKIAEQQRIQEEQQKQMQEFAQEMKNFEILRARQKLRLGDITGLNELIKLETPLNDDDVNNLRNIINKISNDKVTFTLYLKDGRIENYTMRDENLNSMINILKEGFFEENEIIQGSDVIDQAIQTGIKRIEINKAIEDPQINLMNRRTQNKIKQDNFSFFRYINKTNIDLTRYQIINNETQTDILKEHCLIYALKILQIEESIINNIKLSICNVEKHGGSYMAKKNLYNVSDILNKGIILYEYKIKNNENNYDNSSRKIKTNFNVDKYNDSIELCIFENHIFVYDKTQYTTYASKHYNEIKDIDNHNNIIKKKNNKYEKSSNDKYKCHSLDLIKRLFDNNNFDKQDFLLNKEVQTNKCTDKKIYLDNIENEQEPYEYKIKEDKKNYTYFCADVESDTTEDHKPVMIGVIKMRKDNNINHVRTYVYNKKDEYKHVKDFLDYIKKNSGDSNPVVYFHNLKYDYHTLIPFIHLISAPCEKDGQFYNCQFVYKKKIFEFRCSYKLAPVPLAKFNKTFQLPKDTDKKEAIAYNYYKLSNIDVKEYSIDKYKSQLINDKQKKIFIDNLNNNKIKFNVTHTTFNPIEYYREYLRYDVLVLCLGLSKYIETINELTNNEMYLFDYLTISSLTNSYMGLNGAFDGLYQVSGNLREFISGAILGGRVQVLEEIKGKVLNEKIADYDGCSLYPSAVYRLCDKHGLAKGKAKQLKTKDRKTLNAYDYYVIRIRINKINNHQQLPMISYKDDGGILRYTNIVKEGGMIVTLDKYCLEDWEEFQQIEYDIIDGVYWNEGYNKKMGVIISELFNNRLKHKKEGNQAMQQILKLMMNSSYGKTIIKKTKIEKQIVNKKDYDTFICKEFYRIKSWTQINKNQYIFKLDGVDMSYNLAHVGTSILSMSKRIMNEVFNVANSNDIKIYYTDTDSMHLKYDDVSKLEKAFNKKYKRVLTGKQLGQFHIDFDLDGSKKGAEIYATKSLFLAKKCYIDMLESINDDNEKITGVHYRLKGVTKQGIEYKAQEEYEGDIFKLYEDLTKIEDYEICLNPENCKPLFEYKNSRVYLKEQGKFTRKLNFIN